MGASPLRVCGAAARAV